jgi:hypothetical protein
VDRPFARRTSERHRERPGGPLCQGWGVRVAKVPQKVDQWLQLHSTCVSTPLQPCMHSRICSLQETLLQKRGYRISDSSGSRSHSPDIELEAAGGIPLIGIFMHGGGYCHMSADEKSPTSKIPRRLTEVRTTLALAVRPRTGLLIFLPGPQDGRFTEIYCALSFSVRGNFAHANPLAAAQLSNTGYCIKARSRRLSKTQQPFTITS